MDKLWIHIFVIKFLAYVSLVISSEFIITFMDIYFFPNVFAAQVVNLMAVLIITPLSLYMLSKKSYAWLDEYWAEWLKQPKIMGD